MGWILYQIVLAAGLLLAAPWLLARRGRHYLETVAGRLGRFPAATPEVRGGLWIHAVSVGETAVAATLARRLPATLPLVVTTVTPTGQRRARAAFGPRGTAATVVTPVVTAVVYLPFDFAFALGRFFRRFAPAALVLVEGDYWPLALRFAARHGVKVAVVNGRVGRRSFARLRRLGRWSPRLFFAAVARFGVQTDEDRQRLIDLGVDAERVTTTGNLKYDSPEPACLPELEDELRRLAAGRPILLAGSTMKGEEERVLAAFDRAGGGARALLVVAPRHPERWEAVAKLLADRGVRYLRRTEIPPDPSGEIPPHPPFSQGGTGTPDVVLLDSLGELAGLYRVAAIAFIGGTLVPTGGHNPLEPARFAVPIVAGPSMDNFREMAERFNAEDAWRQVDDDAGLAAVLDEWLADADAAAAVGSRGAELVRANQGALERTLAMLAPLLAAAQGRQA
jgi:3-deoxy-D-manno-octulosonic-acid transferase